MGEMRASLGTMTARHAELSHMRSPYVRIQGTGCERVTLQLRHARILNAHRHSNLIVTLTAAEKKGGAWRVGHGFYEDLAVLTDLPSHIQRILSSARPEDDPRHGFCETQSIPQKDLTGYDSVVARLSPAVIYHRAFAMVSELIERELLIDADISWHHGGWRVDEKPCPFAYMDGRTCFLGPRTQVHEDIAVYYPERPQVRRHLSRTTWELGTHKNLSAIADALAQTRGLPLYAWSARNIDRVLLMPRAAAQLMRAILPDFDLPAEAGRPRPEWRMHESLVLQSDPTNALFWGTDNSHLVLDARGHNAQPVSLIAQGHFDQWPTSERNARLVGQTDGNHGHALDEKGNSGPWFPILRAAQQDDDSRALDSAEAYSQKLDGRVVCIEDLCVLRDGQNSGTVLMPYGGVLCRDGRCLGHIAPPKNGWPLDDLLNRASPVGSPVRIASMASCALALR